MCTSARNRATEKDQSFVELGKKAAFELVKCLVVQMHMIFDLILNFFLSLYLDRNVKKVPKVKNDLLLESAVKLAHKIRTREVKSEEVVKAFIERAKEVNPIINAVVEERYSEAIAEAKAVDEALDKSNDIQAIERTKPFFGVPFTTKESNEAKGMLHTMGITTRRDIRSTEDATAVRFLKNAGGILIAKTNVPELNLWCESRNYIYGQTNNPYNTTRTVGGSSGGEGAIIAACGSAASVASDIGGSTRMPAFYNGVFGFKPTGGLTPLKGIGLRQNDYPNSMAAVGPICKKAEDLAPLLKIFIDDKISLLTLDKPVSLKSLNIFYQENNGDIRVSRVSGSMRSALMKAVNHFKELTGTATKIRMPGSEYGLQLWKYWMTQEDLDFKSAITNGKYRACAITELTKLLTGKSEITPAAIMKLIDEDIFPKPNAEWAKKTTSNMKKYLIDKLGENGVLLYPSAPYSAPYHYFSYAGPYNFAYWALFNVLKLPACQVPMGLDEQGLPVGIQVIAAPYKDHLCIAVAKELERAFGGWVPPS